MTGARNVSLSTSARDTLSRTPVGKVDRHALSTSAPAGRRGRSSESAGEIEAALKSCDYLRAVPAGFQS
jgi:hypothetical protein